MPPRMAAALSRSTAECCVAMVATQRLSDPSLRRAAILLSNLDAENRRRLLAHLSPRDAARLRTAAASLSDVDPLEVRRTVSAFVGRVSAAQQQQQAESAAAAQRPPADGASPAATGQGSAPSTGGGSADGRSAGDAVGGSNADAAAEGSPEQSGGALRFLNDVPDATLLRAVQSEHPQTIAVVLASIDPRQAARLLRQLAPQQRSDAVRRLSRLEEVPQDVIDDIGRHLRGLIGTVDGVGNGEGSRLLASIFSQLGAEERQALSAGLNHTDGTIAAALAEAEIRAPKTTEAPDAARVAEHPAPAEADDATTEARPHILSLRVPSPNDAAHFSTSMPDDGERADDPQHDVAAGEPDAAELIDPEQANRILESLRPVQLREVLAELPARDALLTLCGLSPRCVRRLLRTMPRRAAKDVRQRLSALGSLDLKEVDRAKHEAAMVVSGNRQPANEANPQGQRLPRHTPIPGHEQATPSLREGREGRLGRASAA